MIELDGDGRIEREKEREGGWEEGADGDIQATGLGGNIVWQCRNERRFSER